MTDTLKNRMYSRTFVFALVALITNLIVILWGAFVRATGSGAGCGSHWPLCNGQVIPLSATFKTLVEFSHRVSSGWALITVALLVWSAFKNFPKGHLVRKGAVFSAVFILIEALIGAVLVLFSLVTTDRSNARAIVLGIHLLNTFFLVASLTAATLWTKKTDSHTRAPLPFKHIITIALLLCIVGVTGGLAALGNTLFPSSTLQQGIARDFSPNSHILERIRIFHPAFAILTAFYLAIFSFSNIAALRLKNWALWPAKFLIAALAFQLILGFLNLAFLAPIALQIMHLAMADLVWILFVCFVCGIYNGQNQQHNPNV